MNIITDWFENPTFLAEIIKRGVQSIAVDSTNKKGCFLYIMEEQFNIDAENISILIKKHNDKCK